MNTFDSTKLPLIDILNAITSGRIQLPDFQRGWVWDDDHIQDLLVSVARSFPIGAIMLLESGGEVRFQARPVEGVEKLVHTNQNPEKLILDGQQRLTALTQAIALKNAVQTRTGRGRSVLRYYYFDIQRAVKTPSALEDALVAADEKRHMRSNFGHTLALDLSTRELECQHLFFRVIN